MNTAPRGNMAVRPPVRSPARPFVCPSARSSAGRLARPSVRPLVVARSSRQPVSSPSICGRRVWVLRFQSRRKSLHHFQDCACAGDLHLHKAKVRRRESRSNRWCGSVNGVCPLVASRYVRKPALTDGLCFRTKWLNIIVFSLSSRNQRDIRLCSHV